MLKSLIIAFYMLTIVIGAANGYRTTSLTKPASIENYKRMVQQVVRTLSTVQLLQIKMSIIGLAIVGSYLLWFKLFPNLVEVKLPDFKEAVYNQSAAHQGLFEF